MMLQPALPGFAPHRATRSLKIAVSEIQGVVAEYYHIPKAEMWSPKRVRLFARPRQVAMSLTREMTCKSLPAIGRLFGNRDHSTVIHAIRQVARLCEIDAEFEEDVDMLRERLAR